MRAWAWAKRVARDTGMPEPVPIRLERGPEGGYAFRLGVRAGFGGHDVARVPVRPRPNPAPHPILKEIHECEVAGRRLSAANPFALRAKVARQLESLAPARTLPLCFFRVPAMDYELPVYEQGGHVICPVIGGPKLKARDLGGVRRIVCQYLVSAGYVASPEQVEVGVVRPRDLRLVPPAAVFRSTADPALWLPCVEGVSGEGPVVGLLGHATELRARERERAGPGPTPAERAPAAPDVVALLRVVRSELAHGRRTPGGVAVYAADVRPDAWAAAEPRLEPAGVTLLAYLAEDDGAPLELQVQRTGAGDVVAALADAAIHVFLAPDATTLADHVGAYLSSQSFLRFATEVEVHAPPPAPPPERLDADAVWSHGDGASFLSSDPEEVLPSWSSR